ncbi:MAG: DUF1007 family protein, partial [Kiloniellales bacterium]|nr:DUF1007 family protein [Kiloniellales bacterium]
FDEFYTVFTLEVLDPDGDGTPDPALIRELARENLNNLIDYSYFTYISVNGELPAYGAVEDYESYLEDDRLVMEFTVPLAERVNPKEEIVSYSVYDPTYYIEIFHIDRQAVQFSGQIPEGCELDLEEPNPNPEAVSLAASLDRTQSAGDTLGAFFAERVHVSCK